MVIVMRASVRLGFCPAEALDRLIHLLSENSLPVACPYSAKELFGVATADKKRAGDRLTLILPFAIGDSRLYPIEIADLEDFLQKGLTI